VSWKKGDKLKWARMLESRPLAVVDLEYVTVCSCGEIAPLAITLQECAGIFPLGWFDRVPDKDLVQMLRAEIERLRSLLNTPEIEDWAKGALLEAAHQRERWGTSHDQGKTPFDWFWLIGYLAQKAAASAVAGDLEKAKHHTISTGAALANWHLALSGTDTRMAPGLEETPKT